MTDISRKKFIQSSLLGIAGVFLATKLNFIKNKIIQGELKMSYEWEFKKRPYTDEEAKSLLKDVMSPETSDWHYNAHHKGYVTFLNNIEKELETADRAKANGNYSQVGELKRRLTWNHGGALLHDLYWEVLGGDGDVNKGPDIKAAI